MKARVLCAGLGLLTSACAGVPNLEFRNPDGPDPATRLVSHALCEVSQAESFRRLQDENYITVLTLTVKGEDNAGVTPGLAFKTPFNSATPAFFEAAIVGGEFSKKRERSLTQEVTVKLRDLNGPEACAAAEANHISGEFGIADILQTRRAGAPYGVLAKNVAKFGTTVQFTVKWAAAAGPHLVRVHFTGPSDKGMVSASRVDVSTLVIGFAKPPPAPPEPVVPSIEELMSELATPMEKSVLGTSSVLPGDRQLQNEIEAALRERAEREAARLRTEARAQTRTQSGRADDDAADAARGLVNQMILQNLTLTPR